LPFELFDFGSSSEVLFPQIDFDLVAPSCFVFERRELMITNTSVVDDPDGLRYVVCARQEVRGRLRGVRTVTAARIFA